MFFEPENSFGATTAAALSATLEDLFDDFFQFRDVCFFVGQWTGRRTHPQVIPHWASHLDRRLHSHRHPEAT